MAIGWSLWLMAEGYSQEVRLQKQNRLATFEEAVLPHLDAAYIHNASQSPIDRDAFPNCRFGVPDTFTELVWGFVPNTKFPAWFLSSQRTGAHETRRLWAGAVASAICLAASAICLAAFRALNRPRRSRFFISSLRRIRFALFQLNRLVQPRTS